MEKPWKHQQIDLKNLKSLPTPNDIVLIAEGISNQRNRALFIMLYLTAGRVSEVVKTISRKDLNEGIVGDRKIILINMVNRKHKHKHVKSIPIPYDKEERLLLLLNEYLNTIQMDDIMFDISKHRAYQIIRKATGFNPHFIRHIRLTHLVIYNDFNDQLLIKFAGWTDARPSKDYMELKWTDILQKY